jgi:hypothetical protein
LHESERQSGQLAMDRTRSVIFVALNGGKLWTKDLIIAQSLSLQQSGVVRTPTFLDDARHLFEGLLPTTDVPLLTDDYAPVDTMVF